MPLKMFLNQEKNQKPVIAWLLICSLAIIVMISIGGVTRLTDSGLSMTNWKPITGWLPPLSTEEWQQSFSDYQASPEYQKVNKGMSVEEYKEIFWWEYIHRLWGRIIGLIFFLPFLYFAFRKKLESNSVGWLVFIGALGAFQGFIGWWMVKSGLVDEPRVSHLRLTVHFGIALVTLGLLFWHALKLYYPKVGLRPTWHYLPLLYVFFTLLTGAWVAGHDAGLVYNTFPKMGNQWIPNELFFYQPFYLDLWQNPVTIQFMHRVLAILCYVMLLVLGWAYVRSNRTVALFAVLIVITGTFQVGLGILTLLTQVDIAFAALHQLTAVFVFLSMIGFTFFWTKPQRKFL